MKTIYNDNILLNVTHTQIFACNGRYKIIYKHENIKFKSQYRNINVRDENSKKCKRMKKTQ